MRRPPHSATAGMTSKCWSMWPTVFAMANAAEDVKKAAKYCALSNNEEGVLAAIEQLLEME